MGRRGSTLDGTKVLTRRTVAGLLLVCGAGGDVQLAAAAGVPLSCIHKGYCHPGRRTNDAVIQKIATALSCTPADLK